jgi:hypothetical protein
MNGFWQRLVELASRGLDLPEREAVLGDLAESRADRSQALREILGLALRRQLAFWWDWRPWLALTGLVGPMSLLLTLNALSLARSYELYFWIAQNYGVIDPATLRETHLTLQRGIPALALQSFLLASWAWAAGFALALLSRRTIWVNSILFILLLCAGGLWGVAMQPPGVTRTSLLLLSLIQALFVLLTAVWGMCRAARTNTRAGVLTLLWGAAFAAGLVFQDGLLWPRPLNWWLRLLPLFAHWPVLYAISALCSRRWRARTISP